MFRRPAFTLIELLVVMVIIGILATISTATFSGYSEKARIAKSQVFDSQIQRMLATNLVARYSFDGDVSDSSGNNITATTGSSDYVEGAYGQALDLSAPNSVSFGRPSLVFDQPEFTLSFWIQPQSLNSGSANNNIIFGNEHYLNSGFRMGISSTNDTLQLWTTQSGGTAYVSTSNGIRFGKWHHVLVSYDGTDLYLYLDGERKNVDTGTYVPRPSPTGCTSSYGCNNICLNGCVGGTTGSNSYFDEFRWYNKGIDLRDLE